MSFRRCAAVLFDLDGTLVDTVNLITSSFQHTWRVGFGEELSADVARSWIGRTLPELFAKFGHQKAAELQEIYLSHNIENLPTLQQPFQGIQEMLKALHNCGIPTGIVTSKRRASAQLSLDVAKISGIEILAAMEDTSSHKPNPEPLLLGLERLGSAPDETAYVGDAVVDIQAARAAGLSAVSVTWGAGLVEHLIAEGPDAVAHSVPDLTSILLDCAGKQR